MKKPKFIGIFPAQFPGWGRDEKPVFHHKRARTAEGKYVDLSDFEEKPCDMAFHLPSGMCISRRFESVGVAGIDAAGNCWVLARDYAIQDRNNLRWVKFPVEVLPE